MTMDMSDKDKEILNSSEEMDMGPESGYRPPQETRSHEQRNVDGYNNNLSNLRESANAPRTLAELNKPAYGQGYGEEESDPRLTIGGQTQSEKPVDPRLTVGGAPRRTVTLGDFNPGMGKKG